MHLAAFAFTLSIGTFGACVLGWDALAEFAIKPLDAMQKVAFVAAAFSVTAYNLRTRVVDLVLKLDYAPSRIAELAVIVRSCGRKLTNLVMLFTFTALLLGAAGFIKPDAAAAKWYSAGTLALFVPSIVHFVYLIFAFEQLERFMLDDAEDKARQKEAARLLGTKTV